MNRKYLFFVVDIAALLCIGYIFYFAYAMRDYDPHWLREHKPIPVILLLVLIDIFPCALSIVWVIYRYLQVTGKINVVPRDQEMVSPPPTRRFRISLLYICMLGAVLIIKFLARWL